MGTPKTKHTRTSRKGKTFLAGQGSNKFKSHYEHLDSLIDEQAMALNNDTNEARKALNDLFDGWLMNENEMLIKAISSSNKELLERIAHKTKNVNILKCLIENPYTDKIVKNWIKENYGI